MRLQLLPQFRGEDKGDGGIRRIVEAQHRYLPEFGVELVDSGPDVIATHGGSWPTVDVDVPIIHHNHGLYWAEYEWQKWHLDLNKHVIEAVVKADHVTAPSKWVAGALARNFWVDATVLYHGIDVEQCEPGEDDGYVLWNKTRIDPVCDPAPVERLAREASDVEFVSTFGVPLPNLSVTGVLPYDKAFQLVRNASVYLCTARETMGIGTLEAMACGVPVLGWAWGGQAEIIQHRRTGWLAKPNDYRGLEEGLRWLIANRKEVGAEARAYALEHHNWRTIMEQYAKLYESVLQGKQTGPKVSVVVPCYNLSQYLPACVESVQKQDYNDWELIIVDDCSPDDTGVVAGNLVATDSRIHYVRTPRNSYLAAALNYGISRAKGRYIVPLDADNMLGKSALKLMATALDADPGLDIAYGSMEVIEPDGTRFVSEWPPREFNFWHQMAHRNQCPSTSMYRKAVWSRTGGYRRRCRTAEDADFWCRASSLGSRPRKITDAVTLIYRNRSESMSHVERDWPWEAWYSWSDRPQLAPAASSRVAGKAFVPQVTSGEPVSISIVVPVGPGHTELVVDAIDSVYSQTFGNWELIVVNDSGEEIPWLPPFARPLATKGRQGPAVARNLGARAARGPLLLWLDADDYLHPTALERMYDTWEAARGGYVYSDWYEQEVGKLYGTPDYDCSQVLKKLHHAITLLCPKQAWLDVNGFDTSLQAWEDWDFVIAMNNAGYCGTRIPEPLFYYRLRSGHRRENGYENQSQLKEAMLAKWGDYINGSKQLMACGGCSKGGGVKVASSNGAASKQALAQAPSNDMVLLEFVMEGQGTRTYRGQVTGRKYRFGSDPGHRVGYVFTNDAQALLGRPEFRLYQEHTKKMVTA